MAKQLNPKLKAMNAWRKWATAKGLQYPKRATYDQLRAWVAKHGGPVGRAPTSKSKSRKTPKKSRAKTARKSATKNRKRDSKGRFVGSGGSSRKASKKPTSRSRSRTAKSTREALLSTSSSQTGAGGLYGYKI